MTKFMISAAVLLFVGAVHCEIAGKATRQVLEQCATKNGQNPDDAIFIRGKVLSKPAKCTLACIMQEIGALKADGTMDREKMAEMMFYLPADLPQDRKERAVNFMKECTEGMTVPGDLCETAAKAKMCVDRKAEEYESAHKQKS